MLKNGVGIVFLFFAVNVYANGFDGNSISLAWGIPFISIILAIAIAPVLIPYIWHHNYGKIVFLITFIFLIIVSVNYGFKFAYSLTTHAILSEYLPFIILLFALYTVSGGILVSGSLVGTPTNNTIILLVGVVLSSLMGTTGSTMLVIRPLIKSNRERQYKTHIFIFAIILVANIGGGLTPIGDPPLFLGFLKGVTFSWTFKHMLAPVVFNEIILLTIFYFMDKYYYKKENKINLEKHKILLYGKYNFLLIILIISTVIFFGVWQTQKSIDVFDVKINLSDFLRDILLFIIALVSFFVTSKQIHSINEFNWEPIKEVAKLFFGIFITIIPVLTILQAGEKGALSKMVLLLHDNAGNPINYLYFWISGMLSSFLDNAPTYLVFFNIASSNAQYMMQNIPNTLLAISMGSVFLGCMTYVGNAPNFMVKSIAQHNKIQMPSFFGFMLWTFIILIPIFILDTLIFLF